jgi:hypothetical protein
VIRRSTALIRQKWGEDVVVNASIWLIFALPLLIVLLVGTPAIGWALAELDEWQIIWTLYTVTLLVLLTFLIKMTLDSIFAAVTYRYATLGEVHDYFHEEDLHSAFVQRPSGTAHAVRNWVVHPFRHFRQQPHAAPSAHAATRAASIADDVDFDATTHAEATHAGESPEGVDVGEQEGK